METILSPELQTLEVEVSVPRSDAEPTRVFKSVGDWQDLEFELGELASLPSRLFASAKIRIPVP